MALDPLVIARTLIAGRSVTPDDAGLQSYVADILAPYGFVAESLPFGDVQNLWLRRGEDKPLFVFAGHTDVVPPGPRDAWQSDPFEPVVAGDMLIGRGAADMKGAIAAFVCAASRFCEHARDGQGRGSIALLLTSDEEGPSIDGTRRVVEALSARGVTPDFCLVGEPSSERQVGDSVKHGRRGSLNGRLRIHGRQGHVAYPDRAENPIHRALAALHALTTTAWDQGTAEFPPTSLQISNIEAGTGADNVIPGSLLVRFNLRFSPAVDDASLRARVTQLLDREGLRYDLDWTLSGQPFLTHNERLLPAVSDAIRNVTGIDTHPNTTGGTSDGRFIAPLGTEVVELGLCNATIHQANEQVPIKDLATLSEIYYHILVRLLS